MRTVRERRRLLDAYAARVTRLLDIAVATVALLVASPLLLVAAVAIRLESPGGVIYRHERIGRDVERVAFARAVHSHLDDRVLVDGRRTIIF